MNRKQFVIGLTGMLIGLVIGYGSNEFKNKEKETSSPKETVLLNVNENYIHAKIDTSRPVMVGAANMRFSEDGGGYVSRATEYSLSDFPLRWLGEILFDFGFYRLGNYFLNVGFLGLLLAVSLLLVSLHLIAAIIEGVLILFKNKNCFLKQGGKT